MTDEFEQALRRALRPQAADEDLTARVVSRLEKSAAEPPAIVQLGSRRRDSTRRRAIRSPWLPAALAACVIAGLGLMQLRQHALAAARANQARAQLLQALNIASQNVNIVRAAVAHEENPDS